MKIRKEMILAMLVCIAIVTLAMPVQAAQPTTEVHLIKYASDGTTVLNETTVNYTWMEANLPVQGDGVTHYYHQGPTFDENDKWNPSEDTNVESRDYGPVKGTDVKDLCELVGGMSPGDEVKIKAPDGFFKLFNYTNVYNNRANASLNSRQGAIVLCWYNGEGVDSPYPLPESHPSRKGYYNGMRLVFFADNSTNPWGYHCFGEWDMHECLAEKYWHYYYEYDNKWPSSSGLSVKWVSDIWIYSSEAPPPKTWYVDDSGSADFFTIQDAVNASNAGDTIIVRDGTYIENMDVNKSLTIKSENGSDSTSVIAVTPTAPVFDVNADGVTINGFAVDGNNTDVEHVAGIELVDASSCVIVNNDCTKCYNGIHLGGSAANNNVTTNYCHENWRRGISVRDSAHDNYITRNTCNNNDDRDICVKDVPYDNTIWLNNFLGTGVQCYTSNIWNSSTELTYTYNGSTYTGFLGNYYSDYSEPDVDGDGVRDTPKSFGSYQDNYPLMATSDNYAEGEAQPAQTWYVDDSGGADFTTIQDAVNASNAGDTIVVRDGTYAENVDVNKSLTIKSENGSNSTIVSRPASSDHRFEVTADYVNISGFTLVGGISDCGKAGVGLIGVEHCNVTGNIAMNDSYGIRLISSSNNSITNNVNTNDYKGIELSSSSNDNFIADNDAIANADYGIWIKGSHGNTVTHNNVSGAEGGGNIFLQSANDNVITYNTVANGGGGWVGIFVMGSANNSIYLNNFIYNCRNVRSFNAGNIWNSTEPITYTYNDNTYTNYLGNYFDDYTGNDTDSNGIGDTPYDIYDTIDKDYHPLMAPFENYFVLTGNVFDTGESIDPYPSISGTHTGTIEPSGTITELQKLYTYTCPGTGGHSEYVKIENDSWNITANWTGYQGDWHNITFDEPFTLKAGERYNYTIRTGSYPQIIHAKEFNATGGTITCDKFIDANGRICYDWIPAIGLSP